MCGRFTLTNPGRIRDAFLQFRFEEFSDYRLPRFNIAPTQPVLGVRNDGRGAVEAMVWGIDGRINTRSETIEARPAPRRCIIFADGFYEWKSGKPMYYTLRSLEPFAFAGLWEVWREGPPSCTILTCPPNELVAAVHDRMPVMLPKGAVDVWLDGDELAPEVRRAMLCPFDATVMQARGVTTRVNNVRNDGPDLLTHEDPEQQSLGL